MAIKSVINIGNIKRINKNYRGLIDVYSTQAPLSLEILNETAPIHYRHPPGVRKEWNSIVILTHS